MIHSSRGRHHWLLALFTFAALIIALPAAAQGVVKGSVKDEKGQPVDGAKITIEGPRKFQTTTDKKGEFIQIGVSSGTYRVVAEKGAMADGRMVVVRQNQPVTVDIALKPGGGMSAEGAAANAEMKKVLDEAVAATRAGNSDEALAKFNRAIEINPGCGDCYFGIGTVEADRKAYDKAETAYKKAIELKPTFPEAYGGLATIYNAQRKFDLAAAASAKATEFASSSSAGSAGNAETLYNQGVILWNSGKIPEAKKAFESAVQADANHAEAHYQLGMALVSEGNMAGAVTELETYIKLAPTGPNATQATAIVAQLKK